MPENAETTEAELSADSFEEQWILIERAQQGDVGVLPALRKFLDQEPDLWEIMGSDLGDLLEVSISKSMCGEDLAFRESLQRKLRALRGELAGPSPSPIERLLAERIVICWLQSFQADLLFAQSDGCSVAQKNYLIKQQDRACRRFLSSMRTLATIRKMAIPALQVNIGTNQVNTMGVNVNEAG